MVIAAVAQTQWRSPILLTPVIALGKCSYEVYLTHMFIVFALFSLFIEAGKPIKAVPLLFLAVIVTAGILGEGVARLYSEPMNRLLRKQTGTANSTAPSLSDRVQT
jgi:peptidoglycan/LPS O-acetylase OafA/YrhL